MKGEIRLPEMDGYEIRPGVFIVGEPCLHTSGMLRALANVYGQLAVVELSMRPAPMVNEDKECVQ
jgi:hypothetical protein